MCIRDSLCPVSFILHLEHNGDNLHPIFIALAENKVAFRPTCRDLVVLFKIGIWKGKTANLVEFTFRILCLLYTSPDWPVIVDNIGFGWLIAIKLHGFDTAIQIGKG